MHAIFDSFLCIEILFLRLSTHPKSKMAKISVFICVGMCFFRPCVECLWISNKYSVFTHTGPNAANMKREHKIFTHISDFQAHFENLKHHHSRRYSVCTKHIKWVLRERSILFPLNLRHIILNIRHLFEMFWYKYKISFTIPYRWCVQYFAFGV